MAAKKDPAFRTKAKASSSTEAASLLAAQGGFVGFDSAYGGDVQQHALSPEYQLAFKKLGKKDTITKLKGLHELEALFPALDDASKPALLERWVTAFNSSGLDNDRQVREALHHAFCILIDRVKKDLALHLKSIITVWLLNQQDTHREVRTAAQTSFKAAISKKQSEALLFCKNEIMTQLGEYLAHTPQTLSDVKAVGETEATDRWERVISASILTIDFLIDQVPAAELSKLDPDLPALLDAKFWKFLTSRSAIIRRAAYQLVATASMKAQSLIALHFKALAPVIIGAFGDKDAITHSAMWTAMLCFLKAFPAAWEEVNVRKAIWPRLWPFLSSGCYGSAPVSYPSLLPFMQLIPAAALGDKPSEFYTALLNAIWTALGAEGALTQADAPPALKAFGEVTLYAAITLTKGGATAEAEAVLEGPFCTAVVGWLSAPLQRVPNAAIAACVADVVGRLRGRGEAFAALLDGCAQRWQTLFEGLSDEALVGDAARAARWADLITAVFSPPPPLAASAAPAAAEAPAAAVTAPSTSLTPALHSLLLAIATRTLAMARDKSSAAPLSLLARIAASVGLAAVGPTFYTQQLLPAIAHLLRAGSQSGELLTALRTLLKSHLAALPAAARAADFASLLAAVAAPPTPTARAMQFVAPLLQDVDMAPSAELDELCASVNSLSEGGVASLVAVVNKDAFSADALARLARHIERDQQFASSALVAASSVPPPVAATTAGTVTLAAALAPRLAPAAAAALLRSLLPLHFGGDQATAAALRSLYSPPLLARLSADDLASLSAAAEAAFPARLATAEAAPLAEYALFLLQLRGLALPSAAAQALLLQLCGTEAEWGLVAQAAAVQVKGIDFIRLGAQPVPASAPLSFAACAKRVHLALLLLQRGLLRHSPPAEPQRAAALLTAVALFAVLLRADDGSAANHWHGLAAADLTDAALLTYASAADFAAALSHAYAWAAACGGPLAPAAALVAKLAAAPRIAIFTSEVIAASCAALFFNSKADALAALIPVGALPAEFAAELTRQALSAVLSAAPEKAVDVATLQRGATLLAAHYTVNREDDMRLLSLVAQHQALAARAALPPVDSEPLVHAALAAMQTAVVGRLSNAAMLPSQLEFLLARAVAYLRCTASTEAGLLLRHRALALLASLHIYTARWSAQPLPPALALQRDAAAAIVQQVCLVAAAPVVGSARSLAAALESAVLSDRLLGMDTATPDALYTALLAPHLPLQRAAYVILARGSVKQAEALLSRAKAAPAKDSDVSERLEVEKYEETLLPEALKRVLEAESIAPLLAPSDDHHVAPEAVGFALVWSALLDLLQNTQLRSKVTPYLRETRLTARFMSLLFAYIDVTPTSAAPKSLMRNHVEVLSALEATADAMSDACALLLLRSLRILPALVRSWWADDCDRSAAQQIEKYCTKNVSPLLIDAEIALVHEAKKEANCAIKGSRSVQEVSAAYEKDELVIEITVKMPPSYPLKCVEVDSPRRKGMTEALWRKWLLSMTTLLLTQDGSILDAILLWKRSLDSHFDGVECCPICYAVFHASNYSLPRLACKTCKNKFHHACMYKWFQTSHKSTCPLCQTPFSFDKNL